MSDEQAEVLDEDEALLRPIRERVRKDQPSAEFQLLRDKRVGAVVLRSPTEQEYQLYTRTLQEETTRATATHNLFVNLCVYPADPGAVLRRLPGFLHSKAVQGALAYLAGATSEAVGKG
jgi:hypothetical protein